MCYRIATSLNPNKRTRIKKLSTVEDIGVGGLDGPVEGRTGGRDGNEADFGVTFEKKLLPPLSLCYLHGPKERFYLGLKGIAMGDKSSPNTA